MQPANLVPVSPIGSKAVHQGSSGAGPKTFDRANRMMRTWFTVKPGASCRSRFQGTPLSMPQKMKISSKKLVCAYFVPPPIYVVATAVFHKNPGAKARTKRCPLSTSPLPLFPGRRKSPPIEHGAFSAPRKNRATGPLRALCQTLFVWRRARFGPQPATSELAPARLCCTQVERGACHHRSRFLTRFRDTTAPFTHCRFR